MLKSGKQKKEIPLNFQFVFNLLEIMFGTRECENMNALVGIGIVCVFTDNSKMDHIEFALHVRLVLTYHDSILRY